ncbi:MarR family winged helix-turn-helix transcriptional regulator [Nocardioides jensenii]|uniref:MarR family winged helix-turn-helix transcriptional regulator n=1 Tax=Nocardioides jensenii TaxID=1843 RepID=UPI0008376789|nr:MarR family transcriptional regulator [Nocardioides jensenii]
MESQNDLIEQQLFTLLRRTQAIHVRTASGDVELERSSYGILCLLDDEGPQRLGAIAQAFRLDPSTITRQVQTVVRLGLAEKTVDESDRRASLLTLTELGRVSLTEARDHRRSMLDLLLSSWTPAERDNLLSSLRRFNDTVDHWIEKGTPHE